MIIPILSGSFGAYASYRITIKSEKRKEFNNIAEPIIDRVEILLESTQNNIWKENYFIDLDLRGVKRRLSEKDKILFDKTLDLHSNLTKEISTKVKEQISISLKEPAFGGCYYDLNKMPKLDDYIDNLKALMKILKLK